LVPLPFEVLFWSILWISVPLLLIQRGSVLGTVSITDIDIVRETQRSFLVEIDIYPRADVLPGKVNSWSCTWFWVWLMLSPEVVSLF